MRGRSLEALEGDSEDPAAFADNRLLLARASDKCVRIVFASNGGPMGTFVGKTKVAFALTVMSSPSLF